MREEHIKERKNYDYEKIKNKNIELAMMWKFLNVWHKLSGSGNQLSWL